MGCARHPRADNKFARRGKRGIVCGACGRVVKLRKYRRADQRKRHWSNVFIDRARMIRRARAPLLKQIRELKAQVVRLQRALRSQAASLRYRVRSLRMRRRSR